MSQTSIGKAALVLTTDAAQMKAGLAQAGAEAKAAGDKVERELGTSFDKTEAKMQKSFAKMAKKGGALGGLGAGLLGDLGLGGAAGIIAGVFTAVQGFVKLIDSLGGYSKAFNRELEKSARLSDDAAKSMARVRATSAQWTEALADPGERMQKVAADIALAERELSGYADMARQAEADVKKLGKSFSWENQRDWLAGRAGLHEDEAKGRLTQAHARMGEVNEQLAALRQQKLRLADPANDPVLMGEYNRKLKEIADTMTSAGLSTGGERLLFAFEGRHVRELPAAMRDELRRLGDQKEALDKQMEAVKGFEAFTEELQQAAAAVGLTADRAKLLKAETSGLIDPRAIADIRRLIDEKEDLDAAFANDKAFTDFTHELRDSIETFGMSADRARLYRAEFDGVDPEKIAEARRLVERKEALSAEPLGNNAALLTGSSAEVSARTRYDLGGREAGRDPVVGAVEKGNGWLARIADGVKQLADREPDAGWDAI